MKKIFSILLAVIAWLAVGIQFGLMVENRVAPLGETVLRFFGFFTILTNALVAMYFTLVLWQRQGGIGDLVHKPGTLTAITVYITVVGLVYQMVLRPLWSPTGWQRVVDELLHTLIPLLTIVYWALYEKGSVLHFAGIPRWLIYPLCYLVYALLRGHFSGFYPYPFVDVDKLGLTRVLVNSLFLLVLFIGLSAAFIGLGKVLDKRRRQSAVQT